MRSLLLADPGFLAGRGAAAFGASESPSFSPLECLSSFGVAPLRDAAMQHGMPARARCAKHALWVQLTDAEAERYDPKAAPLAPQTPPRHTPLAPCQELSWSRSGQGLCKARPPVPIVGSRATPLLRRSRKPSLCTPTW